ncbi:cysteine desulfurase [Sulfitobacter pseudonitzschiae]|uniref:Cysteine desulfurase n=1 Tax=Pseudosulfitobacter pseudonitzschiae TaxID=1402135 RepID=A0A9Q2NRN0_9RHOB|nr:cysteine desulfurase family protein [Pseudosulfitobacter pseudonitzschiae]MBM2293828.1 cysteine desulfurase [Pseudosulfitobacter pseudonitzschiae]MBM2298745.1 cysteine desulfurase [Pseudosulfitobacter pseudonitzschiae]MBM2303660.1 cysteine desulfurase [Pseudosulfitobacter pseudonitzschiae]MBM2313442.1 cysteine desulfurase [Pseudosulfitobacter pseudonitzschiae]MBM2318356.1 cysteine desulfurase [Pseudosulfitobacter pseudonitzschiae]
MMRIYLDHNATSPLRAEARAAMIAAMDVVGNPSSVHAEGRAAKSLMERARADVAEALGAAEADIVFTSGATEAAGLACAGRDLAGAAVEHDAVGAWVRDALAVDAQGRVTVEDAGASVLQLANSETGVLQNVPAGIAVCDMTQVFGKMPLDFMASGARMALVSAHKLGGPKGIGALVLRRGQEVPAQIKGGGQEMGRRSGTENIIGMVGFAAAAKAAVRDVAEGRWDRVAELRNILENGLEAASKKTIFVGKDMGGAESLSVPHRLPNTSCFVTPGWKGETQVMQMDLAGFAVSAGSACSSGKVRASRVLTAMGFVPADAASALRVSLGLETTEDDVLRFIDAWTGKLRKHEARAA